VKSATTFDYLGRAVAQELPAVTKGSLGKVVKTYDELDRVESSKAADLTVTNFTHFSSVARVFDPEARLSETVYDNLGRVRATRIKAGATTSGAMTFNYRSDGAMVKSTDGEGNSTTVSFDSLGRRKSINDLGAGSISTAYNGFGEERIITDARGAKTTFVRDILGRILERKVADVADANTGAAARDRRATIVWDTAPNGVGQVHMSVSSDSVSKAFAYDDYGRLSAETTVKDGYDYSITRKYDGWGRLSVLGYPEARPTATRKSPGTGVATSVEYLYNSTDGSLYAIRNAVSPWNYYWTAEIRDDLNRAKQARFGNGVVTTQSWDDKRGWLTGQTTSKDSNVYQQATYTYSPVGNMKTRTDDAAPGGSFRESFQYDSLNRLEWWCLRDIAGGSQNCGQAQQGVSYTFSDSGNLKQRKVIQGAQTLEQVAYNYPAAGTAGTKPHAVSSRSWQVGSGQAASFAYDGSGRQWQRPGQVVTYNESNLPEKIVQGTTNFAFEYGPDGSRFRKISKVGTTFSKSTTYVGGIYELREEANLPPSHVFYVTGESGVVAQITRTGSDIGALGGTSVDYLHSDHLGSVSFSTNATGGVGTKAADRI
jgi:YD repeat-containing protein